MLYGYSFGHRIGFKLGQMLQATYVMNQTISYLLQPYNYELNTQMVNVECKCYRFGH